MVLITYFVLNLYTLKDGDTDIEIIAFVLDVVDHKDYNKKFKYKT
jgi:hypothetical protein